MQMKDEAILVVLITINALVTSLYSHPIAVPLPITKVLSNFVSVVWIVVCNKANYQSIHPYEWRGDGAVPIVLITINS